MNSARWNYCVVTGMLCAALFVAMFNYIVDPFEVFHSGFVTPGRSFNDRVNKYQHLIEAKGSYSSLIMGSSVMGAFDPELLNRHFPSERFYNASFLGGLPSDALRVLEALGRHGIVVNHVFMGIDIFQFMQAEESQSPSKLHHYDVTGESELAFYSKFLFASSFRQGLMKIDDRHHQPSYLRFDVRSTGRYFLDDQDAQMKANPLGYIRNKFGSKKESEFKDKKVVWVEPRFQELSALVSYARSKNITLNFFIQPSYYLLLDNLPAAERAKFALKIMKITGYLPDFSANASLTHNPRMFYDLQHYTPEEAKEIVNLYFGLGKMQR